jgi:hypothetical protein
VAGSGWSLATGHSIYLIARGAPLWTKLGVRGCDEAEEAASESWVMSSQLSLQSFLQSPAVCSPQPASVLPPGFLRPHCWVAESPLRPATSAGEALALTSVILGPLAPGPSLFSEGPNLLQF